MESRIKFTRYHGLDAFRCFAMLMGLVIHAPLVFEIPEIVGLANAYKYPPLAGIIYLGYIRGECPLFSSYLVFLLNLLLLIEVLNIFYLTDLLEF